MVDVKGVVEALCLLKYCEERVQKKKGCIMLFTGESGDGKSYSGVRFLELWYKRFFNENFSTIHICNSLEEAILLVRNFVRPGEGILIEELSVHASKREPLSVTNRLWNKFIDVCRIKQAIIVGNCPHISFVDSHFQMMCQVWVNCEQVDFKQEIVLARPLWLQTSPHKKEPYKHKFLDEEGNQIDYCYFKLPDNEILRNEYDKIKNNSNDEIFDFIVLKLANDREKKLKEIGSRLMPKREMEAYILKMNGVTSEEGAKEMGLKDAESFNKFVFRAKKRLKDPKKRVLFREMPKNEEIRERMDKPKLKSQLN